jgi:hypothetical protein
MSSVLPTPDRCSRIQGTWRTFSAFENKPRQLPTSRRDRSDLPCVPSPRNEFILTDRISQGIIGRRSQYASSVTKGRSQRQLVTILPSGREEIRSLFSPTMWLHIHGWLHRTQKPLKPSQHIQILSEHFDRDSQSHSQAQSQNAPFI